PDSIRWQMIPNTYEMWWETDAEEAVLRLTKESAIWWNPERLEKAKNKDLSAEEAVILASIVQAETSNISEAPIVAGLYLNRLKIGQALQADPTLIYAWDDISITRVLNKHKEIDSPYNTYTHAGLPPGTIRTPEPTYIDAVLNAAEHEFFYMCAEPGGTGKHVFERRYIDHLRNARKYQKWLNKQNIYR
ncbi:MAG: endolytic transglycosylase MltG, partial [Flavobacteriales bacterium]